MIYIGKFLHTTNQHEKTESKRRHGEFNVLISAEDKKTAVEKFKARIAEAHESTDLFEGDSQIYLVHILEMKSIPKDRAQLFNFQSIVGDPGMPTISCQAPTADTDGCRIVDWQKNRPGVDGQAAIPFMTFKK
jgi:hypothetical protein